MSDAEGKRAAPKRQSLFNARGSAEGPRRMRHGNALLLAALLAGGCAASAPRETSQAQPAPAPRTVRLLSTADEHGWLFPLVDREAGVRRGGVLEIFERLQEEGLGRPDVVLLSAGDMWTGPYESTLLRGGPMLAAMARMGYRAAAVGNHEFDFGQDVLAARAAEAPFPFLAANIVVEKTGAPPPWARPFTVLHAGGLRLGVVGLTTTDAPVTTDRRNLEGLRVLDYDDALASAVPAARAAGAEEVVIVMHDGPAAARRVVPLAREHGARVVFFGHVHKSSSFIDDAGTPGDPRDDVVACNAGPHLRSYCRVDLAFDRAGLAAREVAIVPVERPLDAPPARPDPVLRSILDEAAQAAEREGGEVLVESRRALKREGGALGQLVVDAWLKSFPEATAAITNQGGLRQDLPAGPVRVRDVVSVLPFDNTLVVVELSEDQLREELSNPEAVVAGVGYAWRPQGAGRVVVSLVDRNGAPIPPTARVKVVVNSFIYGGGDRFRFQSHDPDPDQTGIDWREPVLQELRRLGDAGEVLDVVAEERAQRVE